MPTDGQGAQYANIEGILPTYSASVANYSPYTTATDMVVLRNPATSGLMLRVTQCFVVGDATAAGHMDLFLVVRSALNTGGTSSGLTSWQHDSNSGTAQGSVLTYSAAPTLNGTASQIRVGRLVLAAASSPAVTDLAVQWDFGLRGGSQSIHLRPGQQLSINNNGAAVPTGAALHVNIEWNETPGYASPQ
jgi:hypothetical protein